MVLCCCTPPVDVRVEEREDPRILVPSDAITTTEGNRSGPLAQGPTAACASRTRRFADRRRLLAVILAVILAVLWPAALLALAPVLARRHITWSRRAALAITVAAAVMTLNAGAAAAGPVTAAARWALSAPATAGAVAWGLAHGGSLQPCHDLIVNRRHGRRLWAARRSHRWPSLSNR